MLKSRQPADIKPPDTANDSRALAPVEFDLLRLVGNMPDPNQDPYGPDRWKGLDAVSMRGHIVREHFDALTLAKSGVARWDYEIAAARGGREAGFDMDWVVKKAIQLLRRSDTDIQAEIDRLGAADSFSPQGYRIVLVKNLLYIERLRLSEIDWRIVEKAFPGAGTVTLDIDRDGGEAFPHYKATSS